MQHRESPGDAGALDGALLELMLDHPRPWSEAELARTTSLPGDIPSVLARLSYDGLVNRWGDLASPTFAAARFFGIHHDCSEPDFERRHEFAVLEALQARDCSGRKSMTRKALLSAMRVKKNSRIAFIDAIGRLRAAGLLEGAGKRLFLSRAALRFDQIAI